MSATACTSSYRDLFSLPDGVHYLNCAYLAPLSRATEAAGVAAMTRQRDPVHLPPEEYFAGPDAVRRSFARLINADDPRRIAVLPSVSYAMDTVARNVPLARPQNVVVIGEEFPSAILPWRRLVRARGATLRTVGRVPRWNDALHDAIDRKTAVVVLSHVHWSDGTRFDVTRLAARARDVGAVVVIDGTQSVGALPFNVAEVRPDMLVCAGYKWLMGGYGLSVAYFGERFDDGEPLEQVWTSQAESDDFARLAEYRDAYRSYAERYDGGQRASFVLAPMLRTAIDQLIDWGSEAVQRHCAALVDPWTDQLASHGVLIDPATRRAAHLFGLRFADGRDVQAVAQSLHAAGVYVSVRGDALRVSPHLYNDEADMAALCNLLVGQSVC